MQNKVKPDDKEADVQSAAPDDDVYFFNPWDEEFARDMSKTDEGFDF